MKYAVSGICVAVLVGLLFVIGPHAETPQAPTKGAEAKDQLPPKTAVILKLQEQVLQLQGENARLSAENASLKLTLLDEAKKQAAAQILQEWGGKPGETIDWERLRKVPAPQPQVKPPAK